MAGLGCGVAQTSLRQGHYHPKQDFRPSPHDARIAMFFKSSSMQLPTIRASAGSSAGYSLGAVRGNVRVVVVKVLRFLRLNRLMAKLYYDHVHGFASAGKELPETVRRSMRRAIKMGTAGQGDYYEFGVFKGHTFYQAQKGADELGLKRMRFFGFDSFEGLPAPENIDKTQQEHFYKGQYACSYDSVVAALTERKLDWGRAFLVKGYFNESLTDETCERLNMGKAAVVLIDCDLYASTVDTLRFLEPMLLDGSILIMDDWNAFDKDESRGQRKAFGEFLERMPAWRAEPWFNYGYYGQVFILRTNDAAGGSRAVSSPVKDTADS